MLGRLSNKGPSRAAAAPAAKADDSWAAAVLARQHYVAGSLPSMVVQPTLLLLGRLLLLQYR